jgi:sterol desaturase/sphingolipid hydroxylase (fatty acid hydroxylase superfamily)
MCVCVCVCVWEDAHHRYGGRPGKGMNLGENFWVWDYIFGTYADRESLRIRASVGDDKTTKSS